MSLEIIDLVLCLISINLEHTCLIYSQRLCGLCHELIKLKDRNTESVFLILSIFDLINVKYTDQIHVLLIQFHSK